MKYNKQIKRDYVMKHDHMSRLKKTDSIWYSFRIKDSY